MNIKEVDGQTIVTLSERNLLTLIGLLDMAKNNIGLAVLHRGDLSVQVEPDLIHYRDRSPGSDGIIETAMKLSETIVRGDWG